MQTQSKVFIGIALVVVIIIGFSMSGDDKTATVTSTTDTSPVAQADNMNAHPTNPTETTMGDPSTQDLPIATDAPLAAGVYTEYTPEAVTNSNAEYIILNFSATWCPSCRTLDKNISANVSDIPDGVEIYKVDYDTALEMRKQYGITTQHTLVVVNSDGTMIKKWSGGSTLSGIINKL